MEDTLKNSSSALLAAIASSWEGRNKKESRSFARSLDLSPFKMCFTCQPAFKSMLLSCPGTASLVQQPLAMRKAHGLGTFSARVGSCPPLRSRQVFKVVSSTPRTFVAKKRCAQTSLYEKNMLIGLTLSLHPSKKHDAEVAALSTH